MKYCYLYTDRDDEFHDYNWTDTEEYFQMVCPECNGVSVEHSGDPLDIVVRREPKVFDPAHPGAEILPVSYANFLKDHDPESRIIWGKVLIGKDRKVSRKYVTAYMPSSKRFHARGNSRSVYNACHSCDCRGSSMYENGEEYLVKSYCDYDIIFLGGRSYPVVSESIIEQFDWKKQSGVKVQEFPVYDCPLDGFRLPGDPDWSKICPDFKPNPRKDWSKPAPRKRD